ncbi:CoA-binding protein [Tetragenococcus koreensis]|uniref:CoA-binding protein n=1 Tax=Tetragenococcus koreensis TaxID=290335 RepID=A0AAN4UAJ6_9ENTE|nr:CoA-binding protein [Tetragenococcus koreensis]AYW45185.1 CoA-binding protein [Tetragenococcus koreensis]MCF1585492.1 CoA-binding protein [Tetragenococcus koreensis]MCF1615016.1 CoA-binding protein [Tetragenococcus koreensis]MCF1617288.1 CoA-binding protein [Tetragenococcus koreensis]MCF1622256.1 CoA-binding protein [Tetragenococcus koreensis]
MAFKNPDEQTIQGYLKQAKNVAVVGLSDNTERTSYQVTKVVQAYGYNIFPVNPKLAGQEILGKKVYARLQDVPEPIDIVDIFRRSEFLPEVADDFLETNAKVFWAQLGIESEDAAKKLQDAGRNDIVMDRCIKIELGKLDQQ